MMKWSVLFALIFAVEIPTEAFVDDGFVIGGTDAEITDFPFMVSILVNNYSSCGGTIISNCCILSSALCFVGQEAKSVKVLQGTNNLNNWSTNNGTIPANRILIHEGFNSTTLDNNIALIFLNSTINFSEFASPIELDDRFIGEDQPATILGWGRTRLNSSISMILQQLHTNTISNQICNSALPIYDNEICTFTKVGEGICFGDTGGPLVADGKQIGVLSGGIPCAVGYPDVSARISEYIGWINTNKAC